MPLTDNDIKAELSYAYLHAVAARAGFGCEYTGRHSDNAGVDAYVRVRESLAQNAVNTKFVFEVQLKASSKPAILESGRYSFWLDEVARYDNLRLRTSPLPTLLVVLFLPEDSSLWLHHNEDMLIARRCAYWVSLWDAPPRAATRADRRYISHRQTFSRSPDCERWQGGWLSKRSWSMASDIPEDLLLSLQPAQVRLYAVQAGWKQISTKNPSVILLNHPTDELEQIRVPLNGSSRDRAFLMYEAIRTLAESEHRSLREVWSDLAAPSADQLQVRMVSRDAEAGTLPLAEGLNLFQGGRDLLLAAACSAHRPQAIFPRPGFALAQEFLRSCRLGQTARESYAVTILAPIPPELSLALKSPAETEDDLSGVPYERRVTLLLMLGLQRLRDGINLGTPERVLNSVSQGVSANLCDAVATMAPTDPQAYLQIRMRWSRSRAQVTERIPVQVSFAQSEFSVIREAGQFLRDQGEQRRERVEGKVIGLRAEPARQLDPLRGQVTIRALVGDRAARVRFRLEETDYLRACEAHRRGDGLQ